MVNFNEKMFNINLVFIVILSSVDWQLAVSEDCALAGKNNQHRPVGINSNSARRDVLGTDVEYKIGNTYPLGTDTEHSNEDPQILRQAPNNAQMTAPTFGFQAWRDWTIIKTPPTNFYPRGSEGATVTLLPLTFFYVNPNSTEVPPCDIWIRLCMRAYDTGYVCAHALHGAVYTFQSYCSMEFANCQQKLNLWQLAYFGSCYVEPTPDVGEDFDIEGDNFLEAALINSPPIDPMTGKQAESFM